MLLRGGLSLKSRMLTIELLSSMRSVRGTLSIKKRTFIAQVWDFYRLHGRHDLPWRKKGSLKPYPILVSELMLQQTQVERVIPKFKAFMKRWPTVTSLESASCGEVIKMWQGLGYNRRAKFLHQTAKLVASDSNGRFPKTLIELEKLPGVGSYTASAILAFSYSQPVTLIETNIRSVYLHHFFRNQKNVNDNEILPLIQSTVDELSPREWYWALMDYGSHLKKEMGISNSASSHYKKQSVFEGSNRQIRGAILRFLSESNKSVPERHVFRALNKFKMEKVREQLEQLLSEELIQCEKNRFSLFS